jgi:hypothetical protein
VQPDDIAVQVADTLAGMHEPGFHGSQQRRFSHLPGAQDQQDLAQRSQSLQNCLFK